MPSLYALTITPGDAHLKKGKYLVEDIKGEFKLEVPVQGQYKGFTANYKINFKKHLERVSSGLNNNQWA